MTTPTPATLLKECVTLLYPLAISPRGVSYTQEQDIYKTVYGVDKSGKALVKEYAQSAARKTVRQKATKNDLEALFVPSFLNVQQPLQVLEDIRWLASTISAEVENICKRHNLTDDKDRVLHEITCYAFPELGDCPLPVRTDRHNQVARSLQERLEALGVVSVPPSLLERPTGAVNKPKRYSNETEQELIRYMNSL